MTSNIHSPAQRREYIKYQLRLRGTTLAEISRELGVSTATMSQVCLGVRRSDRVLSAIADKLGVSLEALSKLDNEEGRECSKH
ncbi:helix-turn-helix domain-containing protein [Ruegeria sp. SCP10]|uniref:helix-turn-helix domain-containing protein n=1 Tax=Ruegeria sp. SCP10 TaxID=3141377 RepID=UPI0033359C10